MSSLVPRPCGHSYTRSSSRSCFFSRDSPNVSCSPFTRISSLCALRLSRTTYLCDAPWCFQIIDRVCCLSYFLAATCVFKSACSCIPFRLRRRFFFFFFLFFSFLSFFKGVVSTDFCALLAIHVMFRNDSVSSRSSFSIGARRIGGFIMVSPEQW